MKQSRSVLHLIIDTREQSISSAQQAYELKGRPPLGKVLHAQDGIILDELELLLKVCNNHDEILIAAHRLPEKQLETVSRYLKNCKISPNQITIISYDCFEYLIKWCIKQEINFLPNTFKHRTLSSVSSGHIERYLTNNKPKLSRTDATILKRIWIQYRLMLAIISRIEDLDVTFRKLIEGKTSNGIDTLKEEYSRAIRYFRLGEPDMAGGTYKSEKNDQNGVDRLRERINLIATTDYNVMICGESGSGKEVVAWAIHELSSRCNSPFVAINCAGLSDDLLESEMFGYLKGSHNQATEESKGLLETVNGGTLFLDELPEISARIQAKLLRFLERGEYRPLGGTENRYTDVRIIAAGQPALLDNTTRIRVDLKSRICQLQANVLPLRDLEKQTSGTVVKIAFILLERYTWTNVFRNSQSYELTPLDICKYQTKLIQKKLGSYLNSLDFRESNIRELNTFIRQWLVFGDDEFDRLKNNEQLPQTSDIPLEKQIQIHDKQLERYLAIPPNRSNFQQLLDEKPFQSIKNAYMRHLFEVYSKIVESENFTNKTDRKPTQKELATMMGVTENTLSRYKH